MGLLDVAARLSLVRSDGFEFHIDRKYFIKYLDMSNRCYIFTSLILTV